MTDYVIKQEDYYTSNGCDCCLGDYWENWNIEPELGYGSAGDCTEAYMKILEHELFDVQPDKLQQVLELLQITITVEYSNEQQEG